MKKTIIIFVAILTGVFVFLSLLNLRGEYRAEKAIWKINKDYGRISKDPTSIPSAEFQRVYKNYIQFKDKYAYSKLAPIAHLLAGRVYMIQKEYVKGRGVNEEIIKAYPKNPQICSQAINDIAESYHKENDFGNYVASLKRLMKEYPLTELGFQAPITLAQAYVAQGDLEGSQKAFNEAVDHYNGLIVKYKVPEVAFNAMRSSAVCYMAMKKWNRAVETLSEILMKFPDTKYITAQRADKIITSINMVSITKLKNYDLPIGIYQDFIKKYPEHPYRKALEAMIKSLISLKEKNVDIFNK